MKSSTCRFFHFHATIFGTFHAHHIILGSISTFKLHNFLILVCFPDFDSLEENSWLFQVVADHLALFFPVDHVGSLFRQSFIVVETRCLYVQSSCFQAVGGPEAVGGKHILQGWRVVGSCNQMGPQLLGQVFIQLEISAQGDLHLHIISVGSCLEIPECQWVGDAIRQFVQSWILLLVDQIRSLPLRSLNHSQVDGTIIGFDLEFVLALFEALDHKSAALLLAEVTQILLTIWVEYFIEPNWRCFGEGEVDSSLFLESSAGGQIQILLMVV